MTDATVVARSYDITIATPGGAGRVWVRYSAPGFLYVRMDGHTWYGSDAIERAPRWLRDLITEHAPEWWEAGNG